MKSENLDDVNEKSQILIKNQIAERTVFQFFI